MYEKEDPNEVLDLLVKNEEAIERLYTDYAAKFPDTDELWQNLAAEEKSHAESIKKLQNKNLSFNRGRFKSAAVRNFTAYIEDKIKYSNNPGISLINALSTAVDIEESLIEHRFFEVFPADSPDLHQTLNKLEEATQTHAARLREKLAQERKGVK